MNELAAARKKIKTYNEKSLVVKLEKGNNLRMFCSTTLFEGVKQINESTVRKINNIEHTRNESHRKRVKEKSSNTYSSHVSN